MEINTMEIGKMIIEMVKVNSYGKMEINMMDLGQRIKNLDWEFI